MVSERAVGGLILAAFAIILVAFTFLMWVPGVDRHAFFAVKVVVWIFVVAVSAIAIWLGWVMVSTKPVVPEEKPVEPSAAEHAQQPGQGPGQEEKPSGQPPSDEKKN